jgi:glycosyltransferase involved in cell wall biosynthesis
MRIALYHNLPSGGAKRTLNESTRKLAGRHHLDVYTLSCSEHDFADLRPWVSSHRVFPFQPLPLLESPFGRLNQVLRYADLKRLRRLTKAIAAEIDAGRYDVAVIHPCQYEKSSSILRYLTRTPSVYYCQEPLRLLYETMPERPYDDAAIGRRRLLNKLDPLPAFYYRALRKVDRDNTRKAGRVLVNSEFMAQAVGSIYNVDAQVSYHGVDVEQFRPASFAKRHMVLSVGSLTPLKGFDFLVRAMSRYPAAGRPQLVIASNFQNPPERAYLESLASDLKVEMVLEGAVSDARLLQLYNEAKAVVYAPVREPFGLVTLEAMACGTPVVAVAEGGISETTIDGQTGFLTSRDPKQFAMAVQRVVNDEALARQYGENGRRHVLAHWTWDRAADSLEQHLNRMTTNQSNLQRSIPVSA